MDILIILLLPTLTRQSINGNMFCKPLERDCRPNIPNTRCNVFVIIFMTESYQNVL